MADNIEQWYIDTYCENVIHALQQKQSILSPTVRRVEIKGEKRRLNYIGTRTMNEIKGRWEDTKVADSEFACRWVFAREFADAFPIDDEDIERAFTDPSSDMVIASVAAGNRCKDERIIEAFTAPAITGKNADQAVAFPDANKINIQLGSPSSSPFNTGLTLAKLKRTKFLLDRAQLGKDDPRYLAYTAWQLQNLLDTTEIASGDYNSVRALVKGEVDEFMGFRFVPIELLPYNADTKIRSCYAYTSQSIGLGITKDMTVKTGEVVMKNFQRLTQIKLRLGAVRIHDAGVIEVPCKEDPAEM